MKLDTLNKATLVKALTQKMPFGKYKGRLLMDLPGHYLAWFQREGFPPGTLGQQMALIHELDHNGLLAGLRNHLRSGQQSEQDR